LTFKRILNPTPMLLPLLAIKRLYVIGIIMAKLLQCVKSEKGEQYIGQLIDGIDIIELTNGLWIKA